jgi:tripartite-type tricarboxylate transporter receptor subunit TctC
VTRTAKEIDHQESRTMYTATGRLRQVTPRAMQPVAALLIAFAAIGTACAAERFPLKPVRIIVPFPAGGSTDLIARQLGQRLTEVWGQTVVIDNRSGAGGALGSELVARAAPDGYTLLMGSVSTHAIIPHINAKLAYDPIADFTAITEIARFPSMLVSNFSLPVRNLKQLIALAKQRPGQLTYASNGNGTNSHLAGEMLKSAAQIDLLHIPYRGAAPAVADVVAGHVALMFTGVANGVPYVRSGRLRAIGVASLERSPSLPDVPTLHESGLRGFDVTIWLGLWAPPALAPDLLARLGTDAAAALKSAKVQELFATQDAQAVGSTPADFQQRVRQELARWGAMVKAAQLKPE